MHYTDTDRRGKRLSDFRAALIDMDGTLYDSMPLHCRAWQQLMSSQGFECDVDEFYRYEGMRGYDTVNILYRRALGKDVTPDEAQRLYEQKARIFKEMPAPPVMPGADRMLATLGDMGLKRILVTGSAQSSLLNRLDGDFPGVFDDNSRITALNVEHGKPDPEPYIKGAELAGYPPEECIVIENAPLGVRAGVAAGCFVVAVATGPIPRSEFVKEGANLIFESMDDFADWLDADPSAFQTRLLESVCKLQYDKILAITDSITHTAVYPMLQNFAGASHLDTFVMESGEEHKNLATLTGIWSWLSERATRHSLMLNIGGGVVSDIGGMAAATFKRGIRFINVPTTLLAQADAAYGGKTGIDFNGLKNEIGTFAMPTEIISCAEPLRSLPREELLNGYAEIVKTAFVDKSLHGEHSELNIPDSSIDLNDTERLHTLANIAANIKMEVVNEDKHDHGLRRILNFGHTAGHAYEMLTGCAHGVAVAYGIHTALILSRIIYNINPEIATRYHEVVLSQFPPLGAEANELALDHLIELMGHDKKNSATGTPEFVLLSGDKLVAGIRPTKTQLITALLATLELSKN